MKRMILLPAFAMTLTLSILLSIVNAEDEPQKKKPDGKAEIVSLIEKLGAEKYEDREAAFEALEKVGDAARPHLKKALDNEDAEIRWRASRLLAALDGRIVVQLEDAPPATEKKRDMGVFRDRLKELKELPGFEQRPLDNDFFKQNDEFFEGPFGEIFKELLGESASQPFRMFGRPGFPDKGFPDMEMLMKQLGQTDGGLDISISGQAMSYRMTQQDDNGTTTYELDVDKDGKVTAVVTSKDENGDEKENRYEAEDMESFRKNYPEIAGKFEQGTSPFLFSIPGGGQNIFGLKRGDAKQGLKWSVPKLDKVQRKTLGVYLDPEGPNKVLRAHMGLKANEGVIIEKVLSGSFAHKIDLKPMDIIVSIGDRTIGNVEDIRKALDVIEDGDEVELKVYRNGEKKTLKGKYTFQTTRRI